MSRAPASGDVVGGRYRIVRRLGERRIAILLAGMRAAPNLGASYGREFEAIYSELAAANGLLLYPFFLDGVAAESKLNQRDGIHPRERDRLRQRTRQARAARGVTAQPAFARGIRREPGSRPEIVP